MDARQEEARGWRCFVENTEISIPVKEIICSLHSDLFMVVLSDSPEYTLITLSNMQRFYFDALIAFYEKYHEEPTVTELCSRTL